MELEKSALYYPLFTSNSGHLSTFEGWYTRDFVIGSLSKRKDNGNKLLYSNRFNEKKTKGSLFLACAFLYILMNFMAAFILTQT